MSETVQTLILSGHIMLGILLVTIILIQRGKGSDAGMAFGGGASGTVFGAAGSGTFLTKTTKWLAIAFMGTSLALAYVHNNKSAPTSILDTAEETQQEGDVSPIAAPLPSGIEDSGLDVAPKLEVTSDDGVTVTATTASGESIKVNTPDAVNPDISEDAQEPAESQAEEN
jgi:preprotein translocase subunit SecG